MADFFPVISKAVSGLQVQTPEARRAIYDRARQVLVAQLRNVSPPIAETEITRQRLQLDDVINRIERGYQEPFQDAQSALIEDLQQAPVATTARDTEKPSRPVVASTQPAPMAAPEMEPIPDTSPQAMPFAPPASEPSGMTDRPRLDVASPQPSRAGAKRKLIVLGGIAIGLAAVGTVAFYVNRDNREPQQTVAGTPAPVQQPAGPKINERIGAEPAPVPGPASPSQQTQGAGARTDVAVAQRAVLYMEPADTTQPPRAIVGRVTWRTEAQNAGQGQLLETVVRADVDVPEVGLQLVVTLRRNTDAAFPASHIFGMRFQRTSDDGNGAVREAGVPQFKPEESERGAPLSAITTGLGDNLFVSALSRVPVEIERNIELLRTRNWIDIPVRFASGKRGIIAFEKGLSGDQRIAEALAAWR